MRSKRRIRNTKGQAIVEYSAVIAFVACMVALAFNLSQGSLFAGISDAYSSCSGALYQMNTVATNAGH